MSRSDGRANATDRSTSKCESWCEKKVATDGRNRTCTYRQCGECAMCSSNSSALIATAKLCDCSWARDPNACSWRRNDGSSCWSQCCGVLQPLSQCPSSCDRNGRCMPLRYVLGAQKSGSTSLWELLEKDAGVCGANAARASARKEPHFLMWDSTTRGQVTSV